MTIQNKGKAPYRVSSGVTAPPNEEQWFPAPNFEHAIHTIGNLSIWGEKNTGQYIKDASDAIVFDLRNPDDVNQLKAMVQAVLRCESLIFS